MTKPTYSFTIPSCFDHTSLDCRLYYPSNFTQQIHSNHISSISAKVAVIAHPYAPLGGCYDDSVVLAVAECLRAQGYVVGTFNFRGAFGSQGRTSWTGRAEIDDYISFTGLVLYYAYYLNQSDDSDGTRSEVESRVGMSAYNKESAHKREPIEMLLGGYSYGSLIVARLPPIRDIIERLESAERGNIASEIILRARALARRTRQNLSDKPSTRRGWAMNSGNGSPQSQSHFRDSPTTLGGGEAGSSERKQSHESKRSGDIIRQLPRRVKNHIHRPSSSSQRQTDDSQESRSEIQPTRTRPDAFVRYLLISPVLLPMTNRLAPPGISFSASRSNAPWQATSEEGFGMPLIRAPTLSIFGSGDSFTSSTRLQRWAAGLEKDAAGDFEWTQIDNAGHFWREPGVLRALQGKIAAWIGAEAEIKPNS